MKSSVLRLSFLGLSLPLVACFLPSLAQPTSSSSSCTALHQSSSTDTTTPMSTKWFQHDISITAPSRGCHLITSDIQKAIQKDMSQIKIGMVNLFIQHTSASLTINENADPDVRRDMEVALNKIGKTYFVVERRNIYIIIYRLYIYPTEMRLTSACLSIYCSPGGMEPRWNVPPHHGGRR
jgi:hypothetical protein